VSISDKLIEFAALEKGWCFGEGEPFSSRVLEVAAFIATNAEFWPNVKHIDVFPGRDGQIIVSVYYFEGTNPDGECIDIEVRDG
jgi:hypothetical protein